MIPIFRHWFIPDRRIENEFWKMGMPTALTQKNSIRIPGNFSAKKPVESYVRNEYVMYRIDGRCSTSLPNGDDSATRLELRIRETAR